MKMDFVKLQRKSGSAALLAVACAGLVACVGQQTTSTVKDIPVKIVFDENKCPVRVDPNTGVNISKAADQRILWQSVNEAGNPIPEDYWIFFDPFKNGHLKSNGQGFKKSPKISSDAPTGVEYKYTIEGQDCKTAPLDPRFFLT